jgi:hypothetical protein
MRATDDAWMTAAIRRTRPVKTRCRGRGHGCLELALRLARDAGATPWTIYSRLDRLWERVWRGGGVSVTRCGPKDAIVEIVGWPCAAEPYCRAAMPSVVAAVTELFCSRAFVRDMTRDPVGATSMLLHVQWA